MVTISYGFRMGEVFGRWFSNDDARMIMVTPQYTTSLEVMDVNLHPIFFYGCKFMEILT
jgi:hypothetical protein